MDRDSALSRTTAITGALIVTGLSGTLAVGLVARGAQTTGTTTTPTIGEATPSTGADTDQPVPTPGVDGSGQATSGGS